MVPLGDGGDKAGSGLEETGPTTLQRGENCSQAMLATRVKKAGRVSLFASHLPSHAHLGRAGRKPAGKGEQSVRVQSLNPSITADNAVLGAERSVAS